MSRKSKKAKGKGGRAQSAPKQPRPRRTFKHGLRQRIIWRDAKADYRARLRLAADMSAPPAAESTADDPPNTSMGCDGPVARQDVVDDAPPAVRSAAPDMSADDPLAEASLPVVWECICAACVAHRAAEAAQENALPAEQPCSPVTPMGDAPEGSPAVDGGGPSALCKAPDPLHGAPGLRDPSHAQATAVFPLFSDRVGSRKTHPSAAAPVRVATAGQMITCDQDVRALLLARQLARKPAPLPAADLEATLNASPETEKVLISVYLTADPEPWHIRVLHWLRTQLEPLPSEAPPDTRSCRSTDRPAGPRYTLRPKHRAQELASPAHWQALSHRLPPQPWQVVVAIAVWLITTRTVLAVLGLFTGTGQP